MYGQIVLPLSQLRFAVALLAMLISMYAAIDLHTHQSGLHAPIVCHVCEIEQGLSGGYVPPHEWGGIVTRPTEAVMFPEFRPHATADHDFTSIRAPPTI